MLTDARRGTESVTPNTHLFIFFRLTVVFQFLYFPPFSFFLLSGNATQKFLNFFVFLFIFLIEETRVVHIYLLTCFVLFLNRRTGSSGRQWTRRRAASWPSRKYLVIIGGERLRSFLLHVTDGSDWIVTWVFCCCRHCCRRRVGRGTSWLIDHSA